MVRRGKKVHKERKDGPKPEWIESAKANYPLIDEALIPTLLRLPEEALPDTTKRHGKQNYTVHLEQGCKLQVLLSKESYYVVTAAEGSPLPAVRTISWAMNDGPIEAWAKCRQRAGLPETVAA